jgi:hypothetical protein
MKEDEMSRHVVPVGKRRNADTILVGKPEGRKPLAKHGRSLENNVKMDLKKTRFESLHWINLAQKWGKWRFKLCDYWLIVRD